MKYYILAILLFSVVAIAGTKKARFDEFIGGSFTGTTVTTSGLITSDSLNVTGAGEIDDVLITGNLITPSISNTDLLLTGTGTGSIWATDTFFFENGSVVVPGLAFGNDQDNGLFYIGTNSWGLTSAGVKALGLTSASKVEIPLGLSVGSTSIDASSILDVVSTTKGSRPQPSMTEAQRDAIPSPATGLSVFNTDTDKLNIYDGLAWQEVGSGVGGFTYFPDYEADIIANVTEYDDGATATPVDLTGGSPANTVVSKDVTTPLSKDSSYLLGKAAFDGLGEGFSITSDSLARLETTGGQVIHISFNYETRFSYASDDVTVWIYRVGSNTLEALHTGAGDNGLKAAPDGGKYTANFQASSTDTSFRLGFHIANTGTNSWDIAVDRIRGSPDLADATDALAVSTQTATSFSASTSNFYLIDTSSNDVTANLPAAANFSGETIIFKVTDATNSFIADGNASETIDGTTTFELNSNQEFIAITSDGTNWRVTQSHFNQIVSSSNSSQTNYTITAGTWGDLTSVDLPFGEWAIICSIDYYSNGTVTTVVVSAGASTGVGTSFTGEAYSVNKSSQTKTTTSGRVNTVNISGINVTTTSDTTYNLKAKATGSITNLQTLGYGISARRIK